MTITRNCLSTDRGPASGSCPLDGPTVWGLCPDELAQRLPHSLQHIFTVGSDAGAALHPPEALPGPSVVSPVTPALLLPPAAPQVSSDVPLSSHPEPRPHGSHTCDVLPLTVSLEKGPLWTPLPGRLPGLLQVTLQRPPLGQRITHNRRVTVHDTCPRRQPRQTRPSPVPRSPSKS